MSAKSPYGKSKVPTRFSSLAELRAEIVERRKVLIPSKSHMNLAPKALQKIEEGSELRASMVEKYLSLMGHSATVALKQGTEPLGEIPIGKISEASVLAVKSSALPNREAARQLGKCQDYFSLKETKPSLETAVEIFELLGYDVRFRLYSHGITEEMEQNLELKRGKLGLVGSRTAAKSPQQTDARRALEALFLEG